jgi:hypothetical protein
MIYEIKVTVGDKLKNSASEDDNGDDRTHRDLFIRYALLLGF